MTKRRLSAVGLGTLLALACAAEAAPDLGAYRAATPGRRARLLEALPPDSVVVLKGANESPNEVSDVFRQDSDFWYLTAFPEPDAVAVLRRVGGRPQYTLFVPARDPKAEQWTGLRLGVDGARAQHAADQAFVVAELWDKLPDLLRGARALYVRDARDAAFRTRLSQLWAAGDANALAPRPLADAGPAIHALRLIKDATELELLRGAVRLSVAGHQRALTAVAPQRFEYALKAPMVAACLEGGGARMAYSPIVGSGPNATILHYERADRLMLPGEMIVNDTACEYGMYAADVTRSYPVDGRFTPEQRAIYEIVLAAQTAGMERVRPGVELREVFDATVEVVVAGLLRLGLLEGTSDELIRTRAYKVFYPHGSSHWLGLNVHDAGSYEYDPDVSRDERHSRARVRLRPGMAFTIEPGIYIPAGATKDARYWNIGVRIEDDVLVTESGHECLSCALPRSVADVEAALRAPRTP
jgi:Xaa-Pro aminopeptidase